MDVKKGYVRIMAVILLMAVTLMGCSSGEKQPETQDSGQEQEQTQPRKLSRTKRRSQPEMQDQKEEADVEETVNDQNGEGEGFDTKEEAVLSYLAGLRDNDFGRMEDAFLDKSRAVDIASQYVYLCGFDLIPELASEGYVRLNESGDAKKFSKQLADMIEATDFAGMEFLGFVPPFCLTNSYDTDEYQEHLQEAAEENGGSELCNQVAAIALNDTKYLLFFDTIKVKDRWYILQLGGILPALIVTEQEEMGTYRMDEEEEWVLESILRGSDDCPDLPQPRKGTAVQKQIESEGFDTPQEAAAAYLEGLKSCDTERMLGTFAVESYARNFDLQVYMEHMSSYILSQQDVKIPAVNDFTQAIIGCERREQLKEEMLRQGNSVYFWSCYFHDKEPKQEEDSFNWEELPGEAALDSIEIVGFIPPEELLEPKLFESGIKLSEKRAGYYGADQVQDCVAVFACDGETYCLFMEEVQYDGRWYNSDFGGCTSMAMDVYADNLGTVPLEWLGDSSEVEKLIVKQGFE